MKGDLCERLARVRLLVMDVDGVLTDGRLHYSAEGEVIKVFHVHDGYGIRCLQQCGIEAAIITGRSGEPLERRACDLGIKHLFQERDDKGPALLELTTALGVPMASAAYLGDDLPDLPAVRAAGVGMAPANARPEVRQAADWVGQCRGGHGFVREVCDLIMQARG